WRRPELSVTCGIQSTLARTANQYLVSCAGSLLSFSFLRCFGPFAGPFQRQAVSHLQTCSRGASLNVLLRNPQRFGSFCNAHLLHIAKNHNCAVFFRKG